MKNWIILFLLSANAFAQQPASNAKAFASLECQAESILDGYAKDLHAKKSPTLNLQGSISGKVNTYLVTGEALFAKSLIGKQDDFGRPYNNESAVRAAKGSLYGAMYALKLATEDCKKTKGSK
ncbi:MAG: hypothetical protein JNL01_02755 [Bdellovibrionales bacterium]|nr:hypothetical protein [Bdellovibrionales bacterium]